jgi:hypothetical protein
MLMPRRGDSDGLGIFSNDSSTGEVIQPNLVKIARDAHDTANLFAEFTRITPVLNE